MLLCCLYCLPSASNEYYDNMLDMFDKAILENKDIVIIGDFNFNYTVDETLAVNPVHYLENLYPMSQLIDTPTRVTNKSSTCIYLILTTMPEQHSDTNVATISLSDHYMIYTYININVERKQHKTIRYRNYKMFVMEKFWTEVSDSSVFSGVNEIPEVFSAKEMEKCWSAWKDEFLSISNNNAPIKISRVKDRYNPRINTEIIKIMYQRDYTHDKAVNTKNDLLWGMFKELRYKITSMIRDAKKDYLKNLSSEYKSDTRKNWKELRHIIGDKKNDNQVP